MYIIMEPVYYKHLGTNHKCPDCQGMYVYVMIFQVNLYVKALFGTITKYAGVLIFKYPLTGFAVCCIKEYRFVVLTLVQDKSCPTITQ